MASARQVFIKKKAKDKMINALSHEDIVGWEIATKSPCQFIAPTSSSSFNRRCSQDPEHKWTFHKNNESRHDIA